MIRIHPLKLSCLKEFSMMMAMSRSVLSDMVSISHMWLLVLELYIASETKELNFY